MFNLPTTEERGIVPSDETFRELVILMLRVTTFLLRVSPPPEEVGERRVDVLRIDLFMTDVRLDSMVLGRRPPSSFRDDRRYYYGGGRFTDGRSCRSDWGNTCRTTRGSPHGCTVTRERMNRSSRRRSVAWLGSSESADFSVLGRHWVILLQLTGSLGCCFVRGCSDCRGRCHGTT